MLISIMSWGFRFFFLFRGLGFLWVFCWLVSVKFEMKLGSVVETV